MRPKIVMALLAVGAVVGIGSGIAHMRSDHHHERAQRAAQLCVDAAFAAADGRALPDTAARDHHFHDRIVQLCADAARQRRPPGAG